MPKEHPVQIDETREVPIRDDPNRFFLGHGYKELPFDLPVTVQVVRHVGDGETGLLGWEMVLDVLSRGKVQLKIIKGGGMAVLVDGKVVYKG